MNGIGIGSGIISPSKNSLQVPFKLRARKKLMAVEDKLTEAVRQFPVLYDKSCRDFKDNSKKRLAWENAAKQIKLQTSMYCRSEYSFICLAFSLVRIMLLYGCSFFRFFRLDINYRSIVSAERLPEEKETQLRLAKCGMGVTLKARLTIPLSLCQFTLDQNSLPIPTPLPSLPSLG